LRDDVDAALVVVSVDGRPVALRRMTRPPDGLLMSNAVVSSEPDAVAPPSRSAFEPVSVVVCTRERPDDLTRCLESLGNARATGHDVIVIDNCPITSRTAKVAERCGARYIVEPARGLDRARNAGIAAAKHDIVAFIDDDVVVSPQWLTAIQSCLADRRVSCVTGLVLPLELETPAQEEFEIYCQHRRDLAVRVYSKSVLRPSAAGVVGIGGNMAFRRHVLFALGGFDVRLDAGTATHSGGDTDMFARVLDAGHTIVYSPSVQVWHRHRRLQAEVRACVFGYGVGVYSMLTKRLLEQRDPGALVTACRWLIGPIAKAAVAKISGRAAPRWDTVLAETAGAALGPLCFGYETWRAFTR